MGRNVIRLSVSKAKVFEHCKRQYYYQYVLKLPRTDNRYSALGSLVHLVLETFFKLWIASKYQEEPSKLITEAWFNSCESKEYKTAVEFDQVDQAKIYVKSYFQHYIEHERLDGSKPISCEPKFTLPIVINESTELQVIGFIDRIDQVDYKTIRILDYKTTNKIQYLDNFQLGIYVAACQAGPYKGFNFEAKYILLKHNNTTKDLQNPLVNAKKAVEKMVDIGLKISELPSDFEYKPNYTPLCHWCEHQSRCQSDCGGQESW